MIWKKNWTRAKCNLVPHMPGKQNDRREEMVSGFSRQLLRAITWIRLNLAAGNRRITNSKTSSQLFILLDRYLYWKLISPARNTRMKITKTSRLLPDLLSQKETISKRHQIISKLTQQDGRAMKTVNLVLNKYRNSFKYPNTNFSICQLSAACERFEPRSHFKSIGWVWSSGWT